jgi:hypothetical protein
MGILIWLGVMVAVGIAVWAAAPYHQRLIAERDIPQKDWWD